MLKQYRIAIVGLLIMIAAIVATSLIPLEDGNQTGDTKNEDFAKEADMDGEEDLLSLMGNSWQVVSSSLTPMSVMREENDRAEDAVLALSALADGVVTDETGNVTSDGEPPAAVAETELETEPETVTEPEETSEFDGYLLPVVDVYLNIRETPSTEGAIIGKLYVGALAKIISEENGWMYITSGTVEGYVSSEYVATGKAAEEKAKEDGRMTATVNEGGGLRVRKEPSTEADVLTLVAEGESFDVIEEIEGWVAIEYSSDTVAYLASDFVTVEFELGEAVSIEEELAAIRAAEEAAARKAAEEAAAIEAAKRAAEQRMVQSADIDIVTTAGHDVSYDDTYLLACLVHMEAGSESYEGKLAVANVVLNRLKSGYGNSIAEVIYAKGQFSGANTGALASRLAKGPNDESMQAAVAALAGTNNISDYRNFIAAGRANYNSYTQYTVIGGHCFYKR